MRTLFLPVLLIACARTSDPQNTPAQLGAMRQTTFAQTPQPLAEYSASGAPPLQDLASVATTICHPGFAPANYGMVPQYFASVVPPFVFYAQAPPAQTAYTGLAFTQAPAAMAAQSGFPSTSQQQVPWFYPVNAFSAQWQSVATGNPAVASGSDASTNTLPPCAGQPQPFFIQPPFCGYPMQWPASFAKPQSSSDDNTVPQTTAAKITFVPQTISSQPPHTNTTTQPLTFSQMSQSAPVPHGSSHSTQPAGLGIVYQHLEPRSTGPAITSTMDQSIANNSDPIQRYNLYSFHTQSTTLPSNAQATTTQTSLATQSNTLRRKRLRNSIVAYIQQYYGKVLDKHCRANLNAVAIQCNANFRRFFMQAIKTIPIIKLIYHLAMQNTEAGLRKQFSQLGVNQKLIVAMKLVPYQAFGLMRLLGFDDVPEVFLFDQSSAFTAPFVEADLHNFSVLLSIAQKQYPQFFNYAIANVPELVCFDLINSLVESTVDNLSKTPGIVVSLSNVYAWYKSFDEKTFASIVKTYLVRCPNIGQIVYESHAKYGTTLIYSILAAIQFDSKFLSELPQESYFIEAVIQTYYVYFDQSYSLDAAINVLHYISKANPMYTVADVLRSTAARLPHESIMDFVEKMAPHKSPSILIDFELANKIGATRILAAILALYRNIIVTEDGFVATQLTQEETIPIEDDNTKSQSEKNKRSITIVPYTNITNDNASLLHVALTMTKFHKARLDEALDMVGKKHGNEAKARVEALLKHDFTYLAVLNSQTTADEENTPLNCAKEFE